MKERVREWASHPVLGAVIIDRLRRVPVRMRAIVNFTGNVDDLEAMGIEVHSHIHEVFTVTATKEQACGPGISTCDDEHQSSPQV